MNAEFFYVERITSVASEKTPRANELTRGGEGNIAYTAHHSV